MQQITPFFWMQGTADEAIVFYIEAFSSIGVEASVAQRTTYPTELSPDTPGSAAAMAGQTLSATLSIDGNEVGLINAGPEFRPTASISLTVHFNPKVKPDAPATMKKLWASLAEGGEERMPLDAYNFSPCYGWVEDRYGINWQLFLTDSDAAARPFIMPSLLFSPGSPGARTAVDYYLDIFPGSHLGRREFYPDDDALVLFSDFQIGEQWFTAMDSSFPTPFNFDPGSSLMVHADTQADIDYYWERLSAVAQAERCGWCQDRFGVSWQVAPSAAKFSTLNPAQYRALMGMGKIDLAALDALA